MVEAANGLQRDVQSLLVSPGRPSVTATWAATAAKLMTEKTPMRRMELNILFK